MKGKVRRMADQLPFIVQATRTCHANQAAWLKARFAGIGSSDAAAIVGYSKWQSPVAVWDAKVNHRSNSDSEIVQRVGHALEPLTAQLFTEETGTVVADPGDFTIYTSREWPWMFATVDRLTQVGEPVELKTAWFDAAKEWKERVPLAYQIQCQHQMAVTGAEQCYIAVLLGGTGFKWHVVSRHPQWISTLVKKTKAFWEDYVLAGVMPSMDASESTRKVLEALYPDHHETIVELPEEWETKALRWDRLRCLEAKLKRSRGKISNEVRALIRDSTYAREPGGSGWKWSGGRLTRKAEIYGAD